MKANDNNPVVIRLLDSLNSGKSMRTSSPADVLTQRSFQNRSTKETNRSSQSDIPREMRGRIIVDVGEKPDADLADLIKSMFAGAQTLEAQGLKNVHKYNVSNDDMVFHYDDESGVLITASKPIEELSVIDIGIFHPHFRDRVASLGLIGNKQLSHTNHLRKVLTKEKRTANGEELEAEAKRQLAVYLTPCSDNLFVQKLFDYVGIRKTSSDGYSSIMAQRSKRRVKERIFQERMEATRPERMRLIGFNETKKQGRVLVGQRQTAIVRYEDAQSPRYVLSFGAAPCVIVTMHDGIDRGAVTHIDDMTDIQLTLKMMKDDALHSSQDPKVTIHGGEKLTFVKGVYDELLRLGIPDEAIDIIDMNQNTKSKEVALDLETGEVVNLEGKLSIGDDEIFSINEFELNFPGPARIIKNNINPIYERTSPALLPGLYEMMNSTKGSKNAISREGT